MPLPETMQFIEVTAPGGPEAMHLATGRVPSPGPDEVLVRVLAAGVNRPDVEQRRGAYPPPPGANPVLGLEVAGEVMALGVAAARWRVGDRVTCLTNGGGYAEYCVVPGAQCLPWPDGYDAIRAAALPETGFTVWANLFQMGGLAAGKSALVHGGSSGIGVTAIQLGHALGGTIYATAGTAEKCAACEQLGATAAINYREADFVEEIKRLTGGVGVDVALDMVGGEYVARDLRCLKTDGRLVLIGLMGGRFAEHFDLNAVMRKRLCITGSTMRPRSGVEKGAIAAELEARVWPLLGAGHCAPVIHASFPLAQAPAAHALMESSAHIGKIMLTVGE